MTWIAKVSPPRDMGALAEALAYLLDHPEDARRLGARARDIMQQQFSFAGMIRQYEAVYAQA